MKKIYFVCPNTTHITGGVKQIYKQVEILNRNGISAYVLLEKKKQSNIWLIYSKNCDIFLGVKK